MFCYKNLLRFGCQVSTIKPTRLGFHKTWSIWGDPTRIFCISSQQVTSLCVSWDNCNYYVLQLFKPANLSGLNHPPLAIHRATLIFSTVQTAIKWWWGYLNQYTTVSSPPVGPERSMGSHCSNFHHLLYFIWPASQHVPGNKTEIRMLLTLLREVALLHTSFHFGTQHSNRKFCLALHHP